MYIELHRVIHCKPGAWMAKSGNHKTSVSYFSIIVCLRIRTYTICRCKVQYDNMSSGGAKSTDSRTSYCSEHKPRIVFSLFSCNKD